MSELNIGEIKELSDTSALESNFLTVNFKVAGRVLKNRANDVKAYLATLDGEAQQKLSDDVKAGKSISVLDIENIEPDVFTVNAQAAEHIAANALYQIEVDHISQVVFDGKKVKELLA